MEELNSYLKWLSTFEFHGIKPGLYRIQKLLKKLGNPQNKYLTVHIAGTNGKGSTSAMLESIAHALSLKVGLYTSPHLFKLNERFRINKQPISDEKLLEALKVLKETLGSLLATYFELTTALAFFIFAEEKVDIAIIECGMGGRLDATNLIKPEVSIITSIGFDHMRYLGDTIEKIAFEKACIIKRERPVVVGRMEEQAKQVILDRAKRLNSPTYLWGRDFKTIPCGSSWTYLGKNNVERIFLNLKGYYQGYNLGLALKATEILSDKGILPWDEEKLKEALQNVIWPLRYQKQRFFGKDFLFDCAHNEEGALALRENLLAEEDGSYKLLLLGATNEDGTKPFHRLFEILEDLFDEVFICEFPSPRRVVTISEWQERLSNKDKVSFFKNPKLALEKALVGPFLGIVISGSIYFVAECFKILEGMQDV
jgi:dihydrofolate synthase/folylpolyglutamate synthase